MLPTITENWENLTEIRKTEMVEIGNVSCKLHLLANFAFEIDKVLNSFEKWFYVRIMKQYLHLICSCDKAASCNDKTSPKTMKLRVKNRSNTLKNAKTSFPFYKVGVTLTHLLDIEEKKPLQTKENKSQ